MSKYELELDDDQAARLVEILLFTRTSGALSPSKAALAMTAAGLIREQIPVPVPTKIGAVVQTENLVRYVRWAYDSETHAGWVEVNSFESFTASEMGRITKVLFEGIEL